MDVLRFSDHHNIVTKIFKICCGIDNVNIRGKREEFTILLKLHKEWRKLIIFYILYHIIFSAENLHNLCCAAIRWIRYRTFDRYHIIDTRLKPNYYDCDTRLTEACFSILIQFIEIEYIHDVKMWNDLPKNATIEEVFEFALTFRPDDKQLHDLYRYCKTRDIYNETMEQQDARYISDTEALIELIKIRDRLWT